MIGIYKITNPSQRVYIGQSSNIEKRFEQYKKLQHSVSKQIKLYRSFLKHGIDNHVFEILETCSLEDLNIKERYWQDHFDVLNSGLNCLLTGTDENLKILSSEIKDKIKKSRTGKKHTQDTCGKISSSNKGREHSAETRDKIRKTLKGRVRPDFGKKISESLKEKYKDIENRQNLGVKFRKAVNQLDLEGNYIQQFISLAEVYRVLGIYTTSVSKCCKNKQFSAGGYKWEYSKF